MTVAARSGYNRTLGISDPAFALVNGCIHAGVGRLAMMPLVTLAARLCPKVRLNLLFITSRSFKLLLYSLHLVGSQVCLGTEILSKCLLGTVHLNWWVAWALFCCKMQPVHAKVNRFGRLLTSSYKEMHPCNLTFTLFSTCVCMHVYLWGGACCAESIWQSRWSGWGAFNGYFIVVQMSF